MSSPADDRLCELFVRYWDDVLAPAEAKELEDRLTADPVARDSFQALCIQAAASAELPALASMNSEPPRVPQPRRGWSRRRMLTYLGGGAAAAVVAGLVGRRYWSGESAVPVRLAAARGAVTVRTAKGDLVELSGLVPPGGTVATHGPDSSATLSYPDRTAVFFTGDSVVTLNDNCRRLFLRQGAVTVDVPTAQAPAQALTLATAEATVSPASEVTLTLGRAQKGTEVGVQQGRVSVAATAGTSLGVVREGELLVVDTDGNGHKQALPRISDEFAWDLSKPLPSGWFVGQREETEAGPAVVPELWFDPYHKREVFQIRSDKQWAPGFFRLHPDSLIRMRYWVDRPGPSQLVICVRTPRMANAATGVVECNGAFMRARPEEWQWLEVKAGAMLDCLGAPKFDAPWIGFLVIINTFEVDLGLKVAEFRVRGPGVVTARA